MLRVAFLTTDGRDLLKWYDRTEPSFGTAPEALLQGGAGIPDLEIHVVACTRQPLQSPLKLADNIFFHTVLVPKMGWIRTAYQGCIRATRKELRALQPDIVHGQGTERDCAITAAFSGFPNVLTVHGNMRLIAKVNRAKPFSFEWLAARLESLTIPRSDGVICITHYTQDAVKNLARRTWVIPNAVDRNFFAIERQPDETQTILCVGHICLRKNQNEFIRALDPLAARQKFKALFLGRAETSQTYDREFFELVGARPWCEYGGMAERDRLREYFQTAALLALPSLEDNCPMTVLEAMAAGVPVLAAKVGGVPDLVEENVTGLFCDPQNASSMADGVKQLLNDPALAQRLAVEAKKKALKRFHPLTIAQRHVEIYREVLSKPAAGSRGFATGG